MATAYIPLVDWVLAGLWVTYAAVAFTAMNTHRQALAGWVVLLFVLTVVIAAASGL